MTGDVNGELERILSRAKAEIQDPAARRRARMGAALEEIADLRQRTGEGQGRIDAALETEFVRKAFERISDRLTQRETAWLQTQWSPRQRRFAAKRSGARKALEELVTVVERTEIVEAGDLKAQIREQEDRIAEHTTALEEGVERLEETRHALAQAIQQANELLR